MENFGLFELLNKILTQKQTFDSKKDDVSSSKKQSKSIKTAPLPAYYTNSTIISLIKKHEELSKKIDKDNKM